MNTKRAIRKILFVAMWLAIGGGMLTLLIAAIGKQKRDNCKDYTIQIKGVQHNFFVDDKDVLRLLKLASKGDVKGQPKSAFNLQQMEQLLEGNVWIKDAELYFDNRDVLHVSVTEREPVARLFTIKGKSFYIDGSGKMMPLSDRLSARVPVFTGFPEKVLSRRDSVLLNNVKNTASFILHDPFWMAQVAQVDITLERNFEMTPVVGNHVVLLGDGKNIKEKFHRLFIFYKNVLSKTGFDKYKVINVQYAGQIIGIKNNSKSKPDLNQLKLNVENLLRQAREVKTDSAIAAQDINRQKTLQVDAAISATENNTTQVNPQDVHGTLQAAHNNELNARSLTNPVLVADPVSMKPFLNPKPEDKPNDPKPVEKKKEPKALMKKKNE